MNITPKHLVLKNSVGSTHTLTVHNVGKERTFVAARVLYREFFTLCGKSHMGKWLDPQEKWEVVVEYINHIDDFRSFLQPPLFFAFLDTREYVPFQLEDEQKNKSTVKKVVCFDDEKNDETKETEDPIVETTFSSKSDECVSMKSMNCGICCENYNGKELTPRMLKECGHTVCEKCVRELMKVNNGKNVICPFDRKITVADSDIESFPKNFALLQLVEEKKAEIPSMESRITEDVQKCPIHVKENAQFICTYPDCIVEAKLMCHKCMAENGKHEGHSYISSTRKYKEFKEKINEKLKKLTGIQLELENRLNNINGKMIKHDSEYSEKEKELDHLYWKKVEAIQEEQKIAKTTLLKTRKEKFMVIKRDQKSTQQTLAEIFEIQKEMEVKLANGIIDDKMIKEMETFEKRILERKL